MKVIVKLHFYMGRKLIDVIFVFNSRELKVIYAIEINDQKIQSVKNKFIRTFFVLGFY